MSYSISGARRMPEEFAKPSGEAGPPFTTKPVGMTDSGTRYDCLDANPRHDATLLHRATPLAFSVHLTT